MRLNGLRDDISNLLRFKKHRVLSVVVVVLCSLIAGLTAETLLSILLGGRRAGADLAYIIENFSMLSVYRAFFVFFGTLFILTHVIVNIRVFYELLFKYRYVVAVTIFLLLVVGRFHFSSVAMFNVWIQPGYGSEFVNPIFGNPRIIRSDEWAVTTPFHLSAQHGPGALGNYNFIARGSPTENMPFGLSLGLATLAFPLSIFYIFGAEYGFSARWVGTLIMTFMVALEFAYIISGKKRLFAVAIGGLIAFSPFFQWWSYVIFIPAGLGTLVCFHYFLQAKSKVKRILFALGIASFFSMFAANLYPAWQVPAGYLFLGIAAWMVVENKELISKFKKLDWFIFGSMLVLIAGVILTYLHGSRGYIEAMSNSVYPGARHSFGGWISFRDFMDRMMNGGVYAPAIEYRDFARTNVSEFGGMLTFFPIPLFFAIFMMIKRKTIDLLSVILIIFSFALGSYVYIGWPEWLARITLLSFSATSRALDVLLFAQILLFARAASWVPKEQEDVSSENDASSNKIVSKANIIAAIAAVILSAGLTAVALIFSRTTIYWPISNTYFATVFIGFAIVLFSIFTLSKFKKAYMTACLYLLVMSGIVVMNAHPIMIGLDVFHSKPLYTAISELAVNRDEKWVSLDHVFYGPSFLIISGAPTLNSTNKYPNIELWSILDPEGQYEEVYNRYAHVTVELTDGDTTFELWHPDHFVVRISYGDLEKVDIRFIHTRYPLESNEIVTFTLLYNEGLSRIYSVEH